MANPSITHYPGSQVKITAPFFTMACSCGMRIWSLLGEITPCPNCGRIMWKEGEQPDAGREVHI